MVENINQIKHTKRVYQSADNQTSQASQIQDITLSSSSGAKVDTIEKLTDAEIQQQIDELLENNNLKIDDCIAEIENFETLSLREQLDAIKKLVNPTENNNVQNSESANENKQIKNNSIKEKFSYSEYSKLDKNSKLNVVLEEFAKNQFIFGDKDNPKTEDEWNKLSQEAKNQYTNTVKQKILAIINKDNNNNEIDNLDDIQKLLHLDDSTIETQIDRILTGIHASNSKGMNAVDFLKLSELQKDEEIHEYIVNLDIDKESELSKYQKDYLNENKLISRAIVEYAKVHGMADKFKDGTYVFTPVEIQKYLKEFKISKTDIQLEYLENNKKNDVNIIGDQKDYIEFKEEKFKELSNIKSVQNIVKDMPEENYGRLDEIKSVLGQKFEKAKTNNAKATQLTLYIKKNLSDKSPEEFAQYVAELMHDLQANDDTEDLSLNVLQKVLKTATPEQRKALAGLENVRLQASVSTQANELDEETSKIKAQTDLKLNKKYPGKGTDIASLRIDNSDDEHVVFTSQIDLQGEKRLQKKISERAINAKKPEHQLKIGTDVLKIADDDVAIDFGTQIDKTDKSVQIDLTKVAVERKPVHKAMIDDGTFVRFDEVNKSEAFKIVKDRTLSDDYSDDEAKTALKTLSDWIGDKRNSAKTQAAMHKEIMSLDNSKYSEVIEHAAGNIKNYDPTIQNEAIESVVATGNTKAVETAYTNLAASPAVVQESAQLRQIIETSLENKNIEELAQKIKSGAPLTREEYNSLTEVQKQEYKAAYFKSLSPAKQVEIMTKISDVNTKKAMFKKVAQYSPNLLKSIIEHDAESAEFVYNMHIADDLVLSVAKRKSASVIQFANLVKKIEKTNLEKSGKSEKIDSAYMDSPFDALKIKNKKNNNIYLA